MVANSDGVVQSATRLRGSEGIRRIEDRALRDRSYAMSSPSRIETIFFAALEK
jgi:hypothetical protein